MAGSILGGIIGGIPLRPGVRSFINRLEVDPNRLGTAGGNIRLRPAQSPYFTRVDPRVPGRPDPRWSVDTGTFGSGTATANEGIRNSQLFWEEWARQRPEILSSSNRFLIEQKGLSPRIDGTWTQHFPEHSPYMRETIIHHHVNQGPYAPVPASTYVVLADLGTDSRQGKLE